MSCWRGPAYIPLLPQTAGAGWAGSEGEGRTAAEAPWAGQLVEGWRRPQRVFSGLPPASSLTQTFSTVTPGKSPSLQSLCSGLQPLLPRHGARRYPPSHPGVPLHCLSSPVLAGQQVGASTWLTDSQGSVGAFPKSAGGSGAVQATLLPPPAGLSPGRHSRLASPGGGLGSWSVVLALALQFQPFLELGRVQLPCKAPHTTLLFSLFRLSVHGAVGVPGGGGGWGQVHLRLLQHSGHIQLLGTERGDGVRSHLGQGPGHTLPPHT